MTAGSRRTVELLLVDDTLHTLNALAGLLRDVGYRVHEAASARAALATLEKLGKQVSFVFLDQVLDGVVDGGTRLARMIAERHPEMFIVMYTADAQIDDIRRWEALNAGAHRYIRKASAAELLADVDEFIEDIAELRELTEQIEEIANARQAMFSVLVGLDVGLTIIDREYRVWFANRHKVGVGLPRSRVRCWTFFHGHSAESGPCFGCLIRKVFESGQPQRTFMLAPEENGTLRWFRHEALPVRRLDSDRVIAVRETSQRIESRGLELSENEIINAVATSILHQGYGRVRIYRAIQPSQIRCDAVATRYLEDRDREYRSGAVGFTTDAANNPYVARALEERTGSIVRSLDSQIGIDAASKLKIEQKAPWIDLPIWRNDELVSWLSVDLEGTRRSDLGEEDLERLRPFGHEIRGVLDAGVERSGGGFHSRRIIDSIQAALANASDEKEAIGAVLNGTRELVESRVACLDVQLRIRQDGELRLLRQTNPRDKLTPDNISEEDPGSLAAYVVRFGNDLFIPNAEEFEAEARRGGILPQGIARRSPRALAILRTQFEGRIFGTLHVECWHTLAWQASGLMEPLARVAEMTALLLRDIIQNRKIEEARAAAERQLAQAFGAIHGIKGPVQASRNFLETIEDLSSRRQLSGKRAAELARKAGMGLGRIERLAERLLRLVREREEKEEVERVDLREVLPKVCSEAAVLIPGLKVSFEVQEGAEVISIAKDDFVAILDELLTNAERAGAGTVRVRVRRNTHGVIVRVGDDGKGVTGEESLKRIFERWYHTFPRGVGLGLPFVRKAVEDVGGEVIAEQSSPGLEIVMRFPG